jgi:hypothetical protein
MKAAYAFIRRPLRTCTASTPITLSLVAIPVQSHGLTGNIFNPRSGYEVVLVIWTIIFGQLDRITLHVIDHPQLISARTLHAHVLLNLSRVCHNFVSD